jgi:hypothetical protein
VGNWGTFVQLYLQWKATSITYSESVFVALGNQYAMRMHHIVICNLPCSTIFFNIISQMSQFLKNAEHKNACFDFVYNFCPHIFPV